MSFFIHEIMDHESLCGAKSEPCDKCKKNILLKDFDSHYRIC